MVWAGQLWVEAYKLYGFKMKGLFGFTQNMFLQKTGIGKKEDLSRPAITRPFSVFIHFRFLSKSWP